MKLIYRYMLIVLCLASFTGCGSSTATDDTSSDSTADANSFSVAFPSSLVVASPTASTSSNPALIKSTIVDPSAPFADKLAALEDILGGTTIEDCDFTFDLVTNTENASCYGPTLTYSNHPDQISGRDANTTDADAAFTPNDTDGDGSLPGGDVGIWRENKDGSTEACAAAQLNKVVDRISGQIDSMVYAMASLLCIANVNELEVPTDGSTLDLTSVVNEGFTSNGIELTVDNASLTNEDSTYTSILAGTGSDDTGNPIEVNCRLKHSADDNGVTYSGKLSCTVAVADGSKQGNCNDPEVTATGYTDALSIGYTKNSATIFTAEVNSGNFCGASGVEPFVSDTNFTVDSSKKLNLSLDPGTDLLTGWANNFNYARYQLNSSTSAGSYLFAWQAGRSDSFTRVLNVDMDSVDSSGNKSGCAYFGFGPDIEDSVGEIDGMICNWAGPGSTKTATITAQQQCMDFNSTTEVYESDSASLAISYAPTNSCDTTGLDPDGNTFTYSDTLTTVNTAVTNNLVPVADMPTINPPSPTDVDS